MYLRETKRRNRDGSTVSYLQLAHSERHPVSKVPSAKVIHNFGRAEAVDRDALGRLVASISRFLDPQQAIAAAHTGEIDILDSRRFGGAWLLDRLWERLGIGAALHRIAAGWRLNAEAAERVLFALTRISTQLIRRNFSVEFEAEGSVSPPGDWGVVGEVGVA